MTMARRPKRLNRSRNQNQLERIPVSEDSSLGDRFLIYTEGKSTEVDYFMAMRVELKLHATVLVHHPNATDPVSLALLALKRRDEEVSPTGSGVDFDQIWIVVDRERSGSERENQIKSVRNESRFKRVSLAVSNPSFEYWLLLHFCSSTSAFDGSKEVIRALKKYIPNYNKSNLRPKEDLFPKTLDAVKHARMCRKRHDERDCELCCPSTDVDKLVRQVGLSVRRENRDFLTEVCES